MRDSNCGVACAPKPPTRTVSVGSLGIFLLALFGLSANALRAQEFSEFPVPTADSQLRGITAGPDGNIWFSEQLGKKIGRITPSGVITEFPITGSLVSPEEMTAGPDGNVWFSDFISVGRVTPSGTITRFPIASNSFPGGIVTGPDGNIWFTLFATDHQRIGRISPAGGVVTEFPVFGTIQLKGLTTGPDGNLWFTDPLSNQVGRMTTSGAVMLFPLPAGVTGPYEIVTGPDGNLWFTSAFHIGRMTTAGVVTAFADPGGDFPTGIAAGPDGNMWFTEQTANHIVRITLTGQMTEFTPPTVTSGPLDIAAGSDGALWFIETRGNKIGRITVGTCAPSPTKLCLSGARFSVSATWQSATGSGVANAISLTSDTGYFWFFNSDNVELVVKVLNACSFSNRIWVFAAGLTDVQVNLTVTDNLTGAFKTYVNLQGTAFQPIQDTNAFATCDAVPQSFAAEASKEASADFESAPSWGLPSFPESASSAPASGMSPGVGLDTCVANATTLCLESNRFAVTAAFRTATGSSGSGTAVALTSDTGYFWFFGADNVEVVLKVLNACSFTPYHWVFAAGLTNVEVTLTVTDTQTGVIKQYQNPLDTPFQPRQDTTAFQTCP